MKFDLERAIPILERTPKVLEEYLNGLTPDWTSVDEGEGSWSPIEILAHLILGEQTDWIIRAEIILSDSRNKAFVSFDMNSHIAYAKTKSMEELLNEFARLRADNIKILKAMNLTPEELELTGLHPEFGKVSLKELLATWVTHDLGHISQISRVMACQYKDEVGPWKKYLGILNK